MVKIKKASISVVIPVKNEEKNIKKCIEGILMQSVEVLEIIVIDSGSTDKTLEILEQYTNLRIINIDPAEFNHGLTRNIGVKEAKGEFILYTVGDARAYNEYWIEELVKHFDHSNVAGVCGQQVVPHEADKNPVEYFRPQGPPDLIKYQFKDKSEFLSLPPTEKKKACGWDDVNAMYKREVLIKIPFQKTNYSEDAIWAKEALLKGYMLVYNYASRVYHYHWANEAYAYKRMFTTSYYNYKYFGYVPEVPKYSVKTWLSLIKLIILERKISFFKKLYWINYNFKTLKAMQKSIIDFKKALHKDEKNLDTYHERICGLPPIPPRTG